MMKECKHKNIVAYFGSYHRCLLFSGCPPQMCGIPGIVGGYKYVEFDFYFPTLLLDSSPTCSTA